MADLRRFLDQADETHPHEPRAIADQLLARATALPADETGAEAVRLAEHVMLGHLADADALQRFLQALPRPSAAAGGRWTRWRMKRPPPRRLGTTAHPTCPMPRAGARCRTSSWRWPALAASPRRQHACPAKPRRRRPMPTPRPAAPMPSARTTWRWNSAKARAATPRAMR
jgi:hypothetical protein